MTGANDTDKILNILQLYPKDMNIYGDWGNTLVLKKRAEWYGYKVNLLSYDPGEDFPFDVDVIVGGGGQDSGQEKIQDDLLKIGPKLQKLALGGTPMLVICGLYQLFGHYFQTADGNKIKGIGIFDITTTAGPERLIGNIVTQSSDFGQIVGYENHSGQTFLNDSQKPLGEVIKGAGNNGHDNTEGAITRNVIGTYLHGSLLPKNPAIADFLIKKAVEKKYGSFKQTSLDDALTHQAREVAINRPR